MSDIILGRDQHNNRIYLDLDILLRTRLLIQANSGGGKSYLLRRIAEKLFGKIPVIIIDPEGEFATLREKFGYVLVGHGGETPADTRSAGLVAMKLLELRASAVCDLYELKPAERHRWVRIFLEAAVDAPKKLWRPTVFILDEFHQFCPERAAGESEASDATMALATRGRKRQFCMIGATQRVAKVRKDATAELLNRLIGPTFEDLDLKRAADLLSITGEDRKQFDRQMRVLEPGWFFALGRALCKERTLTHVGKVETTHEIQNSKHGLEPPPPPDKVKALLPKLADLPKEAEKKAKTEAELRSEIRSLQAQLRNQAALVPGPQAVIKAREQGREEAEREIVKERVQFRSFLFQLRPLSESILKAIEQAIQEDQTKSVNDAAKTAKKGFRPIQTVGSVTSRPNPDLFAQVGKRYSKIRGKIEESVSDGKLRSGAERMLAAVASWSPNGMTEGQMRAHAGLKKSGTFTTYMSDLRTGSYIEERNGLIFATDKGIQYCGELPSPPQTTEEVLAVWEKKLRSGCFRMLKVLVDAGGEPLSREELTARAELAESGTFTTYLTDLRTAKLITDHGKDVSANRETLFL